MNKKNILIIAGSVIVLIGLIFLIKNLTQPKKLGNDYFTIEPQPWIEENRLSQDDNDVKINIKKATRDKSMYIGNQQDYNLNGETLSFFTHSYYKGTSFRNTILSEEFFNYSKGLSAEELNNRAESYLLMNIGPEMDPDDGVINGFILGKIEDDEFVFYIFVDEDWKNSLEKTKIVWGNDFYDEKSLNIRDYDFDIYSDGIYIDKITGADWFKEDPRTGGIMVGEINLKTPSLRPSEINSTFIYIR